MNCFLSPLFTVVAKNIAFFAGSLLAVLIALTIYDEDVLAVEHVLSSITLLGVCITVCRYCFMSPVSSLLSLHQYAEIMKEKLLNKKQGQ